MSIKPPGKIIKYDDIKLRYIKALDLFAPHNDVLLLKKHKFKHLKTLAGCVWETIDTYFLTVEVTQKQVELILAYICKIKFLREAFNGYVLFGTHWYGDNRITRYYGLKRKYEGVNLEGALINELENKDEKEIAYQGIKNINTMSIDEINQIFDIDGTSCFLIYLPDMFCAKPQALDELLQALNSTYRRKDRGFPSYSADFMILLEKIIALGGIIITKFSGLPTDYSPEVSGYYGFANAEVISKL